MAFSTQSAVSDGTLVTLLLTINYIDQQDVTVFIDDVEQTVDVDYEWVTANSIGFLAGPVADASVVLLVRRTQLEHVLNVFADGATFNNATMDENFEQLLFVAQEAQEGGSLTDVFNDVDMHGNTFVNLQDAVEAQSPVTLAQLNAYAADSAAVVRQDLANATDPAKGAGQVGRSGQVVGSISALRLLSKNTASQHAFVTGYYAQGDGGGGPYYLDAADTTSADDGGLTIVASDGARWKSSLRSLTLTQWGCVGDGVTDDLIPAQRAVNHAAATNGVVIDELGRNFKLSAPLVVTGSFRSVKFKGVGTGDAQTASSGGSCFLVTGTPNAIEAHFLTFANENIIVEGFSFYNTALDQLNGGSAIKLIRGDANSRYISGFVFRDVGILGFGAAFTFQGMNTVAVENNYWGPILMDNVSIQGTGIAFYIKNSVLNLLNMQSVNLLDCKFGGFRLEADGDVGVGLGKGSAITASLHKCHFEGVGGMFRTQPTAVTGTLGTIRNDISLYDFTHESCGSTTGPVAGEPFVLGVNNDLHIFGKVDNGIPFGEVSLPRLNTTTRIDSASKMTVWMDGGRSLSPTKVNSPTYYRTVLNGNSTVITVGVDQAMDFAIKSTLILSGGNAGIVESLHQGNTAGAPVRTAIAGAATAGITLTWGAAVAGGAIQLTVDNASGFTVAVELQIENVSSATITAGSEV